LETSLGERMAMASTGQTCMHAPHPVQADVSMTGKNGPPIRDRNRMA
jgi:hypothetical protein